MQRQPHMLRPTLPFPRPTRARHGHASLRCRADGKDVVLDIRFAEARVAQLAAKPQLRDALQADEAQAMPELCGDAALKPFIDAGGGVRRRFIDADGELFFEVRLKPADCPTPDLHGKHPP